VSKGQRTEAVLLMQLYCNGKEPNTLVENIIKCHCLAGTTQKELCQNANVFILVLISLKIMVFLQNE